jgi:hypothetical protein
MYVVADGWEQNQQTLVNVHLQLDACPNVHHVQSFPLVHLFFCLGSSTFIQLHGVLMIFHSRGACGSLSGLPPLFYNIK